MLKILTTKVQKWLHIFKGSESESESGMEYDSLDSFSESSLEQSPGNGDECIG